MDGTLLRDCLGFQFDDDEADVVAGRAEVHEVRHKRVINGTCVKVLDLTQRVFKPSREVGTLRIAMLDETVAEEEENVARPMIDHSLISYGFLNPRLLATVLRSMASADGSIPTGGKERHRPGSTSMNRSCAFEKTAGKGCAAERNRNRESSEISPYSSDRNL
jgi:hypothetical protein